MNAGPPQADRPDASADRSDALTSVRSRPIPRATVSATPTTAQLIHRTDATIARPLYASLGVALHHFTEMLADAIDPIELHRATTVLTKQVHDLLDHDDALDAIDRLVTDPARVAMPDGRTAIEFCGERWSDVRAVAHRRARASCEGALEFGLDAIINLAVVRSVGSDEAWWGTPMWAQRVDLVLAGMIEEPVRSQLLSEPELVEDDVLAIILKQQRPLRAPALSAAGHTAAEPGSRHQDADVTNQAVPSEVQALGSVLC